MPTLAYLPMQTIYLIDAFNILFRSYYAISSMSNKEGFPTGALFGFIRSLEKFMEDFSPEHLCVVFDGPNNKQKRLEIYEEYKKNRAAMPEDLYLQLGKVLNYCRFRGLPVLQEEGVEADDVIGSITLWAKEQGSNVFVISSDKDLCQLIDDKTKLLHLHKGNKVIGYEDVVQLFGVKPEQIVDYLAIAGDSADNIPGIPGFGPKTSATLLNEFGSIDNLLISIDQVSKPKWREKITEHKETLLMSQQLASLHLDAPFPHEESFFTPLAIDYEALTKLYKTMNFSSLLKKLTGESAQAQAPAKTVAYHLVDDERALAALMEELQSATHIAFDTETTGLNTMECAVVGVGLGIKACEAYYIPLNGQLGKEKVLACLKPLFASQDKTFIAHNLKFDMHALANMGLSIKGSLFDTMIAAHLVEGTTNQLGLDALTLTHFQVVKTPITDLIGTGKKQLSMFDVPIEKVSPYCCSDVDFTFRLMEHFTPELTSKELTKPFYELEMPLLKVLCDMERAGVLVDSGKFASMSQVFTKTLAKLETVIFEATGSSFNIKSPKQLGEVLFDKMGLPTPGGKKTTKADVLEKLKQDYPFIKDILHYRAIEKLRSTYVDALPQMINANTGRIHCTFSQVGTATGRLACHHPNLQNIPTRSHEGKKIREAFIPQPGHLLLAADYSQIELRLLAHFCEDPTLIEAFKSGQDIHTLTASKVFHVPLEEVTSDMRGAAKTVNFGILYGQSAFGLASLLDISTAEARAFIKQYFASYPKIKDYLEKSKQLARETEVVTTLFGRKRPLKEINSTNGMVRSAAERLAINTPIQGSQADIIKKAMISIQEKIKKSFNSFMILQIHDELIFEVAEEEVESLSAMVKQEMEGVVSLSVPLPVNILVGKNWKEC